jgi:hypothetical protein
MRAHTTPLGRSGLSLLALTLAACATVPVGPSWQALPGSQRTAGQFAADDARCRTFVNEQFAAGSSASQGAMATSQQQYDAAYYACMYALGHKVPVPAHDAARYRDWFESVAETAARPAPAAVPAAPATPGSN